MNDFAKEELELILKNNKFILEMHRAGFRSDPSYENLLITVIYKIQSMIDNYSEYGNKTIGLNPDLSNYDLEYPDDSIITAFILKNVISELENLIKDNIEIVHSRIDTLQDHVLNTPL